MKSWPDYQDEDNGGDGWLRVLIFQARFKSLQVRTYSPTKGRYDSGREPAQARASFCFHSISIAPRRR
jgi:hypothetical protein